MPKGKKEKEQGDTEERRGRKETIRKIKDSEDIVEVLRYTTDPDPEVKLEAVKQLCPCRCKEDVPQFWIRVFNLVDDQDPRVRDRILHIICDGSPSRVEEQMHQAMQKFNRDPDSEIRRRAHKVLAHYERTGKWNIL